MEAVATGVGWYQAPGAEGACKVAGSLAVEGMAVEATAAVAAAAGGRVAEEGEAAAGVATGLPSRPTCIWVRFPMKRQCSTAPVSVASAEQGSVKAEASQGGL